MKKRIISGAGAWGYGPCATLVLLLESAGAEVEVDFIGISVSMEFAEKNAERFNTLYKSYADLPGDYDLALSVMEPDLLIWAQQNRIPSASIDNLYWMWNWDEKLLEIVAIEVARLDKYTDSARLRQSLHERGEYADYSLMYVLSQKVFWQKFSTTFPANLRMYKDKVEYVEPIVAGTLGKTTKPRTKLLVSFSGMINPYVDDTDLYTYLLVTRKILEKALRKLPASCSVVFTVHPSVQSAAEKIFHSRQVFTFNHAEFIDALNESLLLIAPAGMATIYESLACRVPLFSLPEQHDGNYVNYLAIQESCSLADKRDFGQIFPEAFLATRISGVDRFQICDYYQFYINELAQTRSEWFEETGQLLLQVIKDTATYEKSVSFAEKQSAVLEGVVGDFEGGRQVMQSLQKMMG